jgi:hypothetical protein
MELTLLFLLFTKHFIVDFPLQTKYQWSNKGTFLHPGGLLHAGLHGLGTYLVLFWYAPFAAVFLATLDSVIHYFIDWSKMNLNKKLAWGPTTHEQFWWLLGLDQYLHALTYLGLVWLVI